MAGPRHLGLRRVIVSKEPPRAVAASAAAQLTLPDLLTDGLDVVFVGINPSVYSAERGRYFARPGNRFWPCVSRSTLTQRVRDALGVRVLGPEHDRLLLAYGIGFTDLVKRPTAKAGDLTSAELVAGVTHLLEKVERYRPRIACFHGVTGYRPVQRRLAPGRDEITLGRQITCIGATQIFLVPNPSGANAHFTREDQVRWYDALANAVDACRAEATP